MHVTLRRIATVIPFTVLPHTPLGQPAAIPQPPSGYVVRMQFTDRTGVSRFSIKVLGGRFRVDLDDIMPLLGSVVSAGPGGADALAMLGQAGPMAAGGYVFSRDSGTFAVILPAMNVALAIDQQTLANGRQRGFGGPPGGPPFGGPPGGGPPGRGGRGGRPGRGGPPPDTTTRASQRGQKAAADSANANVTVTDLGAGDQILGHATHKFRFHVTSSLDAGGSCPNAKTDDVTTDAWFASDLSDGGFTSMFSLLPLLDGGATPAPGSANPFEGKMPQGMLMKMVSVCDTPNRTPVGTLEVTALEPTSFEAADFDVPVGMQLVDPNAMGGRRGRRGGG